MTKEILNKYYDRLYSSERSGPSIELISTVSIPTTRFEAIVKFFPRHFKGGDIIEFGAGNGNVAKTFLTSKLKIASYTLGDISLPRIEGLLKNIEDSRVTILQMNVEDIPESMNGNFDAIIMVALIEHLIDPLRVMQQIRKFLKPGGFVYIDTPNIAKYTQRVKLLLGKFPSTASMNEGLTTYEGAQCDLFDEGHLHYFTYRSLSLMLTERCGFSRVIKLGYPAGRKPFGKHVHNVLATIWPELFSELAIIAYA